MEYWNDGIMGKKKKEKGQWNDGTRNKWDIRLRNVPIFQSLICFWGYPVFQYSIIPTFQSVIPTFQSSIPLFQQSNGPTLNS
jgi:hypothetical protein